MKMIAFEEKTEKRIEEGSLFQGAKEKYKEAQKAYDAQDWDGCLNNLNTAFELILKEKLDIPTTIKGVKTANIVEILVKHDVGPVLFLKEARKHVTNVDNSVKHDGYEANKIDCIPALKSMEDLIRKLDNTELKIADEIKKKIYGDL